MNSTPPKLQEDKELTKLTQQYVVTKPLTAITEVELTPSSYLSERKLATQLTEDNAKNEAGKKTLEEARQTLEPNRVRENDDGAKGHAPRAKTTNMFKAM